MLDAINRLQKLFPDANYSQLRSAFETEVDAEQKRLTGRRKYERAVDAAENRIKDWIETASEFQCGIAKHAGSLDVTSTERFLQFVGSHRHATVWSVLFGLTRKAVTQ